METQNPVTENLADFGARERLELKEILEAWEKHGLPDDFIEEGVRPMMNKNSGYVFLTNSEYQTCMLQNDKLEIWHNCPNCGNEGFLFDMGNILENGSYQCQSCKEEF